MIFWLNSTLYNV